MSRYWSMINPICEMNPHARTCSCTPHTQNFAVGCRRTSMGPMRMRLGQTMLIYACYHTSPTACCYSVRNENLPMFWSLGHPSVPRDVWSLGLHAISNVWMATYQPPGVVDREFFDTKNLEKYKKNESWKMKQWGKGTRKKEETNGKSKN